jgi:NADPH-dependent glutamate synthase beta subunit-like oxidoreductase
MISLTAQLPEDRNHRSLISCQAACPVHTDAWGYVRAIAKGRFEEAYLTARGPNPFASICWPELQHVLRSCLPPGAGSATG